MAEWTDALMDLVDRKTAGLDAAGLDARWRWADDLGARAEAALEPEKLRALPPAEIYGLLRELGIPQCPIRIANLGRTNEAEHIVASLLKLLETPGGFAEKYRAAKFPQAGMATITELLCVARPRRFICRNTAFTRALAKVTPFYGYAALNEMGYEEFLDICRVLADKLGEYPVPVLAARAKQWRFLWLYAVLTD